MSAASFGQCMCGRSKTDPAHRKAGGAAKPLVKAVKTVKNVNSFQRARPAAPQHSPPPAAVVEAPAPAPAPEVVPARPRPAPPDVVEAPVLVSVSVPMPVPEPQPQPEPEPIYESPIAAYEEHEQHDQGVMQLQEPAVEEQYNSSFYDVGAAEAEVKATAAVELTTTATSWGNEGANSYITPKSKSTAASEAEGGAGGGKIKLVGAGTGTGYNAPIEVEDTPLGWGLVSDPDSGSSYYYNYSTGESSWENPEEGGAAVAEVAGEETAAAGIGESADSDLPYGWQAVADEANGTTYYWNWETDETSYYKPEAVEGETGEGGAGEAAEAPNADAALPEGWQAVTDEAYGVYYYNFNTEVTQYEYPTA